VADTTPIRSRPSVTTALRRIRLLAADLTRELARQRSSDAIIAMTATIYREADAALVTLKNAKPSKR
jgi:hypothetical protein